MHFCDKCGNMYYIRLTSENKSELVYYCRKCGNENKDLGTNSNNICVSKTHLKKNKNTYKNIINKYTKLDPTLPRITNIDCPNNECKSNLDKSNENYKDKEILYLRYNDNDMKFIYLCGVCETIWKNDKDK